MTDTSEPHVLAAGGLFTSGTDLAFATIGFLAALVLVIGTVSAIRTHAKEGAGSGITAQIGTIVFSVLILLSVGHRGDGHPRVQQPRHPQHRAGRQPVGPVTWPTTRPPRSTPTSARVTIYLGDSGDGFTLPFKEKWRAPDAVAAVIGFIVTGAAVTANLTSGHALRILIVGALLTAAAVWLLSKLPPPARR